MSLVGDANSILSTILHHIHRHLTWAGCWWRRCRGRCFSALRRFCGPGASAGRVSAGGKRDAIGPRGWCTAAPGSTGKCACCWQTPRNLGNGKGDDEGRATLKVDARRRFKNICIVFGPTWPAALHELEQDVDTHCSSQGLPAAAISQFIHCERDKDMKANETIGLKMWQTYIIKNECLSFVTLHILRNSMC